MDVSWSATGAAALRTAEDSTKPREFLFTPAIAGLKKIVRNLGGGRAAGFSDEFG
jgi:hypothetical protein